MGIPGISFRSHVDTADIIEVGTVTKPPPHLHQRIIHDRIPQKIADC